MTETPYRTRLWSSPQHVDTPVNPDADEQAAVGGTNAVDPPAVTGTPETEVPADVVVGAADLTGAGAADGDRDLAPAGDDSASGADVAYLAEPGRIDDAGEPEGRRRAGRRKVRVGGPRQSGSGNGGFGRRRPGVARGRVRAGRGGQLSIDRRRGFVAGVNGRRATGGAGAERERPRLPPPGPAGTGGEPASADVDEAALPGGAAEELADPDRLRAAVEAVLLVVDMPTSTQILAQVLGRSVAGGGGALHSLRDEYDAGGRGFDLREVADGWRLYSRDEFAALRRALRPRRPAGPADPGGARDTRGHRLPTAGDPLPYRRHPGCERRRGDAYPAHPGPRGGVRRRTRTPVAAFTGRPALPGEDGASVVGRATVSCSTPTRYLAAGRCRIST